MSLNSWLCKKFDEDNKGYVEVSDIIEKTFKNIFEVINIIHFIIFILIPTIIGLFYYMFKAGYSDVASENTANFILAIGTDNISIMFFKMWIIGVLIYGIIYIIYKILKFVMKIKVAKCSLKNKYE